MCLKLYRNGAKYLPFAFAKHLIRVYINIINKRWIMIRLILVSLVLVVFFIISIPVMVFLLLLRFINKGLASDIAQFIISEVVKLILAATGSSIYVSGTQNIPKEGTVLFVSNHRSYFDIAMAYAYTHKRLGFIAKAELGNIPLLREWMFLLRCRFLDRTDMKKSVKTILAGIKNIKTGTSVWICPEGTRVRGETEFDMDEFKEGAFKIAEKGGCPIVPVAIKGTADIFEKHIPFIHPSSVIMEYGEPIYIDELDKEVQKKLGNYTRAKIAGMLSTMENRDFII